MKPETALAQYGPNKGGASRTGSRNEGIRGADKHRWPSGKVCVRLLTSFFMPLSQLSIPSIFVVILL